MNTRSLLTTAPPADSQRHVSLIAQVEKDGSQGAVGRGRPVLTAHKHTLQEGAAAVALRLGLSAAVAWDSVGAEGPAGGEVSAVIYCVPETGTGATCWLVLRASGCNSQPDARR